MYIKRLNKIKYIKDSIFKYELPLKTKLNFNAGESIKKDDIIGVTRDFEVLQTFNLVEMLKVKPQEVKKYLKVFDKEYISEGDILAERSVMGGLGKYEAISEYDGFVDLSEIKKGTIKILGEIKESVIRASANATIDTVIHGECIEVKSNVLSISLNSSFGKGEYMGEFIYVPKEGNIEELDIMDKVVLVNDVLDKEKYLKISEFSPKAIICSVVSPEFSASSCKIHNLFNIFGVSESFELNKLYVNNLSRMSGLSAFVSSKQNVLSFSVDKALNINEEEYTELKTGMKVFVTSNKLFGLEVTVLTVNDFDIEVKTEDGKVEYLSFDEVAYIC